MKFAIIQCLTCLGFFFSPLFPIEGSQDDPLRVQMVKNGDKEGSSFVTILCISIQTVSQIQDAREIDDVCWSIGFRNVQARVLNRPSVVHESHSEISERLTGSTEVSTRLWSALLDKFRREMIHVD